MRNLILSLLALLLIPGCATSPKRNDTNDTNAISANVREHLTIDEARRRIVSPLEETLEKLNARLKENLPPVLREQLMTDRDLMEKDLARRRQKFDEQIATFNPATDEIRTYQKPALTLDGRDGESGIVLIQKDKVTYLWRLIHD